MKFTKLSFDNFDLSFGKILFCGSKIFAVFLADFDPIFTNIGDFYPSFSKIWLSYAEKLSYFRPEFCHFRTKKACCIIYQAFCLSTSLKHKKSRKFQKAEFLEFQPEFYTA